MVFRVDLGSARQQAQATGPDQLFRSAQNTRAMAADARSERQLDASIGAETARRGQQQRQFDASQGQQADLARESMDRSDMRYLMGEKATDRRMGEERTYRTGEREARQAYGSGEREKIQQHGSEENRLGREFTGRQNMTSRMAADDRQEREFKFREAQGEQNRQADIERTMLGGALDAGKMIGQSLFDVFRDERGYQHDMERSTQGNSIRLALDLVDRLDNAGESRWVVNPAAEAAIKSINQEKKRLNMGAEFAEMGGIGSSEIATNLRGIGYQIPEDLAGEEADQWARRVYGEHLDAQRSVALKKLQFLHQRRAAGAAGWVGGLRSLTEELPGALQGTFRSIIDGIESSQQTVGEEYQRVSDPGFGVPETNLGEVPAIPGPNQAAGGQGAAQGGSQQSQGQGVKSWQDRLKTQTAD